MKDPQPEASAQVTPEMARTADGEVFEVPESHDMIHTLLDPRLPKTPADYVTVSLLLANFYLFYLLPRGWRTPVFFVLFAFWRSGYNAGLGWLLKQQSERQLLTKSAKKYRLFSEQNHEWYNTVAINETKPRLKDKYSQVPIEYKTWILFRHLVDLILMQDFVSYCLLGLSCFHHNGYPWTVVLGQWTAGICLIVFNLWVKIDAHRVVKDYAWFWGDFFFLKDSTLVFDGVFEMAPHPMYTIGYAAYYGLSLITASPALFTASILAHAAQFAFLCLVENPHIDKTYPSEPPVTTSEDGTDTGEIHVRAMLIFKNFNFTRPSDVQLVALSVTTALLYLFPASPLATILTFFIVLFWRTLHTGGLGLVLRKQSESRLWTRLFLKFGKTRQEAYQQWQVLYNTTTVMSYVSLAVLVAREWSSPLVVGYWPFRYILGAMLIALQAWTSYSIWDALGEYGWFFGDFFLPTRDHHFSVSGIYRYLNHPERLVGISGVWGAALMACSTPVTISAFVWTFYNLGFIQYVEKPHIQQVYGVASVNRHSGVTKNIEKATPLWLEAKAVELWQKFVVSHFEAIEELRPRVEGVVDDTKQVLRRYSTVTGAVVKGLDRLDRTGAWTEADKRIYQFGEPVTIQWRTAKLNSDRRNWIGIYKKKDHPGPKDITRISSAGRWSGVDATGYAHKHTNHILHNNKVNGDIEFVDDTLFWEPGVYEARLHFAGGHMVLAVSTPFEIKAERRPIPEQVEALEKELVVLARTVGYDLTSPQKKNLVRFTDAIEIFYGIELAPFVVQAEVSKGSMSAVANRVIATYLALKF